MKRVMKRVGGSITISRVTGSQTYVNIEFHDEHAGVMIAEAQMGITSFGEAITGLAHVPCEVLVNTSDRIGKTREYKRIKIELPPPSASLAHGDIFYKTFLEPHEKDGWIGRLADLKNHHNRIGGTNIYRVTFERWV